MKAFLRSLGATFAIALMLIVFQAGSTRYGRLITTENPDFTGANNETWSNNPDGTWSAGAANIRSTGGDIYSSGGNLYSSYATGYVGGDNFRMGYNTPPDSQTIYGAQRIKVWNVQTGGADIAANDLLVWYNTAVEFAADTTATNNARITNNVQYGYGWPKVTRPATVAADTITIYGKDPASNSISDVLTYPAGSVTVRYSTKLFSDVDSVDMSLTGETGNYEFDVLHFNAVKACDGNAADIAGVATAAIGDSGNTGWAVVEGFCKITTDAATLAATPGILLIGASGGDAVTVADAVSDSTDNAKIVGFAVQPSNQDNTAIWCYVNRR